VLKEVQEFYLMQIEIVKGKRDVLKNVKLKIKNVKTIKRKIRRFLFGQQLSTNNGQRKYCHLPAVNLFLPKCPL